MKKEHNKWVKVNNPGGVFYSPSPEGTTKYMVVGDGINPPTPEELLKVFRSKRSVHTQIDNGSIVSYWDSDALEDNESLTVLPAGIYTYKHDPYGSEINEHQLRPITIRDDKYIQFKKEYNLLLDDIKQFLESKHIYKEVGLLYKLGLLLYGDAGNSKTSTIRKILQSESFKDAIVIFIEKSRIPPRDFLEKVKNTLDGRLKVFIFEELANTIDDRNIAQLLDFLDGESSLNDSIIFATTNYPDKIPGNIINRTSRFDKIYNFKNPDAEERRSILKHFSGLSEISEDLVKMTNKYSVSDIKEICITSRVKNVSMEESVKLLESRKSTANKNFQEPEKSLGF